MKTNFLGVASLVASTLLPAPPDATAGTTIFFNPVSAIANAYVGTGSPATGCWDAGVTEKQDIDWWGNLPGSSLVVAYANAGSANAGATLHPPNTPTAYANAGGGGMGSNGLCTVATADSTLTSKASIYDPQGRPSVKLRLTFKATSGASPGPTLKAGAGWSLIVSPALANVPSYTINSDGSISFDEPYFAQKTLWIYGSTDNDGSKTCDVVLNSCVVSPGQYYTEHSETIVFDNASSELWFQIAVAGYARGAAAIDPIIEPDPENPDVVVTMEGPIGSGNSTPSAGFTAEQLIAEGIDPGPFIRLGFLDASAPPPPPPPPPPSGDTTPPATSASATPGANALGWNNAPVTVTFAATDNAGGSGVKEVHYSLAGAATASQVVAGNSATVTINAEGTTTLSYFAVDNAGNQEAAKTLTVRIDRTPPTVTGLPSNCTLWPPDHRLVQVASIDASDAVSGLAGPPIVTATSSEPETGTGHGDLAPDIVISGGTVQLRAERADNRPGRIYTITAIASDLAGNVATKTATCVVPHDQRGHHNGNR